MAIAMRAATTGGGILCSSARTRIDLMPNGRGGPRGRKRAAPGSKRRTAPRGRKATSSSVYLSCRLHEHRHGQIADFAFRGHNEAACPGELLLFFGPNILETFDAVGKQPLVADASRELACQSIVGMIKRYPGCVFRRYLKCPLFRDRCHRQRKSGSDPNAGRPGPDPDFLYSLGAPWPAKVFSWRVWQAMQRSAAGLARSRSRPISPPQSAHTP